MKMNGILNRQSRKKKDKATGHPEIVKSKSKPKVKINKDTNNHKEKNKDKQQKKKKMSLRLPFLVVNNAGPPPPPPLVNLDTENPLSPAHFQTMESILNNSSTPKTVQMTPTGGQTTTPMTHPTAVPSTSSYVDLDSSMDMDTSADEPCVPAEIDAQVQSMLSPFGQTSLYEDVETYTHDYKKTIAASNGGNSSANDRGRDAVSVPFGATSTSYTKSSVHENVNAQASTQIYNNDNNNISRISYDESSDDDQSDEEIVSFQSPYDQQARVGIARQAYSNANSQACISDVTPILNMRTTEQYSNANQNPQYQQDMAYQQNMQTSHKGIPYANSSSFNGGSLGISVNQHQNATSTGTGTKTTTSKTARSSSPYEHPNGELNLHRPILQQGPKVDTNNISRIEYALDNDRFITPGHAFLKKDRSLPRLFSPEKGEGLGIVPPPRKARSARVIVPHVTPPSYDLYSIFILVIQPSAKKFELIRMNYHPATATIGDLVQMISDQVTEEDLRHQKYVGLCRPHGSSSASRSLTKMEMTASVMARDGTCARILCGEVLVAISEGYTGKETQILSQHILRIPQMRKLLGKPDPLSPVKSKSGRPRGSRTSPISSLGIQPMSKNTDPTTTGTFSSSVLFAPLSAAIQEERAEDLRQQESTSNTSTKPLANMMVPQASQLHAYNGGKGATKESDDADTDDSTGTSSEEPTETALPMQPTILDTPKQAVSPPATTYRKQEPKTTPQALPKAAVVTPPSVPTPEPVSVPLKKEGCTQTSPPPPTTPVSTGLTAVQLELIKYEAAAAARIAAEEAFTMRLEELIQTLNVPTEQKTRILEDPPDDLSFHSALTSWVTPSPSSNNPFPGNINLNDKEETVHSMGGLLSAFSRSVSPLSKGATSFQEDEESPAYISTTAECQSKDGFVPSIEPSSDRANTPIPIDPELGFAGNTAVMNGDELLDDFDEEVIATTMEGFFASAVNAISDFVDRKKDDLRQIPDEVMKRKMALKAMSLACTVCVSSKMISEHYEDATEKAAIIPEVNGPCTLADFQQALFWFLLMVQGQNYVENYKKSKRRKKSRSLRSRVKAIR